MDNNNNENTHNYEHIHTRGLKSSLNSKEIEDGKFRFAIDSKEIFLDYNDGQTSERIIISDYIKDYTEEEILNILAPLPKFYLAKDTLNIFYYTVEWIKLNKSNAENIKFILGNFSTQNSPSNFIRNDMYYNKDDGLIYTAINENIWDNGTLPEEKVIYVNLDNNTMYVYQNGRMLPYGTEAPYIYDTIIDKKYTWSSRQIVDYINNIVLGGES